MQKHVRHLAIFLAVLFSANHSVAQNTNLDAYFKPVPNSFYQGVSFDMPRLKAPQFPDYTVNITDFGAVPGGKKLNSSAINKAIKQVSEHGGGTVIIPAGIWLTGPIVLQSNVNLHAKKGALILFSTDFDLYPLIKTSYEGSSTMRNRSPIMGDSLENIAITGEGVFDGNGQTWRPVKKGKMTPGQWQNLIDSGGYLNEEKDIWYPTKKSIRGSRTPDEELETLSDYKAIKDYLRPVMVSIRRSKNILLDGPTFQNSPAWCLHPLMDKNVIIRNVMVRNPWYAQNGDGLDLESVTNALIYNDSFDVGDDAICIKSGKNEAGRKRGMPTQNAIIRGNTVYHGHGGFVIGSEMSGGVNNIKVADMTFIGTDVGIRFKSTRGRGGTVENIDISDINMVDIVTEPIRFNLYYGGEAPSPNQKTEVVDKKKAREQIPEVTVETPQFRDISIENVVCRGAGQAMWIQGLPEMNVQNVTLKNVDIIAEQGGMIIDTDQLNFSNIQVEVEKGPALFMKNVHNLDFDDTQIGFKKSGKLGLKITGPFTEKLNLSGITFHSTEKALELGPNVEEQQITKPNN